MTTPIPSNTSEHVTDLYLDQLEALREEITVAMLAISKNSIRVLDASLWRQEVLCVSLARLLEHVRGTAIDGKTMSRMQSATAALQHLNSTYADLVQQSRSSADLLHSLCHSYVERMAGEAMPRSLASCSLEA